LYTINSSEKLQETYSCEKELEDICIVERLFSSSLIAIVSMANPRKLRVFHFKKGTEICNYCYSNTVLSVRLNRNRLVVCLEERIDIHNISDMRVIHTIRDIPANPKGLCALSIDNEKSYLAYPGSSQVGEVQIFDTINLVSL
jgi:autophagy-related protein 18